MRCPVAVCPSAALVCLIHPPGKGLDLVRLFYSLLPQRHRWVEAQAQAAVFIIDETFAVPGVGTVVAGAAAQLPGAADLVMLQCWRLNVCGVQVIASRRHCPSHDVMCGGRAFVCQLVCSAGGFGLAAPLLIGLPACVAAGTVKRGVISPNTSLLLGPDIGDGSFKTAAIKSIVSADPAPGLGDTCVGPCASLAVSFVLLQDHVTG